MMGKMKQFSYFQTFARPDKGFDRGSKEINAHETNPFLLYLCLFRQAWSSLGDMSRETAMTNFVTDLDKLCPLFKPYVKAHKAEQEEQERQR